MEKEIRSGKAFTMADGHYVLIEFQPEDDYSRIRQGLQAIQMEGYWPILAHAERCRRLAENVDYVEELVRMGIYIQINAKSVAGGNGWRCKSCTHKLLKDRLVHFVASDGHDTKKRAPVLFKTVNYIAKKYGRIMLCSCLWRIRGKLYQISLSINKGKKRCKTYKLKYRH